MSNVPHRHTTPEEDIQNGKIMIVGFSVILAFCLLCLIIEPDIWFGILIVAIACICGILAGKEAKESGERRKAERERATTSNTTVQTTFNRIRNANEKSSLSKKAFSIQKETKLTYNSVPDAVNKLLSENPGGLKASKMAEITGLSKKEINSYLYSHKNLFTIDDTFIWTRR